MANRNQVAQQVLIAWLDQAFKQHRKARLVRQLAYLDNLVTTEVTQSTDDLAAAQAAMVLPNEDFLACLLTCPFHNQILTGDAIRVQHWFEQALTSAHSQIFSNIGLLMEIVLDQESGCGVAQWDDETIGTANCLAGLANDQFLTIVIQLQQQLVGQPENDERHFQLHLAPEQLRESELSQIHQVTFKWRRH
ncbi:hypothetical protein [Furfurilactobacillus curtus]|uniref:Uncharacterized protein n=1 Tax=Furfurilactobacillus curtus TaxID=1746200 RepID=A0ABQ5JUN3_9LACO